jgi:SAM-dependent methyltransferase
MDDMATKSDRERQYAISQSISSQFNVISDISPDDMLFDFLLHTVFSGNYTQTVQAYFSGGEDCARRFAALCGEHLQGKPQTILEFASGYGRVARHARRLFPETQWTSSDVHTQAVAFGKDVLGLDSFLSPRQPANWTAYRTFDVVFALSFFSHMPDKTFGLWLEQLFRSVTQGGLLIFTTHGAISLRNMRANGLDAVFDQNGYYWNGQSDQRDLDSRDYGTSAVTFSYVLRAIRALPECELIRFQQAFWWAHQDVYILRKQK